jgi:hypothetical protein
MFKYIIAFLLIAMPVMAQDYSYTIDENGNASVLRIDKIPGLVGGTTHFRFNGVIPAGEAIHPEIPSYIKEAILRVWEETYEKVELPEIPVENAFEEIEVERVKEVEGEVKQEPDGFEIVNGKVEQKFKGTIIYETETVKETKIREDVFLDQVTGKVYLKAVIDGRIHKEDGKLYQWVKKTN